MESQIIMKHNYPFISLRQEDFKGKYEKLHSSEQNSTLNIEVYLSLKSLIIKITWSTGNYFGKTQSHCCLGSTLK